MAENVEKFRDIQSAIEAICAAGNNSELFSRGSAGYRLCMEHYLDSSSDEALFSVEPGSVTDLAAILRALQVQWLSGEPSIPFAVKGGGHATNPGFSSTKGVHICMTRFNNISWEGDVLQVGAGCLYDDIYDKVQERGRNIVGGYNHEKIGVAGWVLGGGYSLKTNRYGLGIDNVVGFHIVLPDGNNLDVTKESYPDLFKALRGGGNNFGIVTRFDLKTHEQGRVFGGILTYEKEQVTSVKEVIRSVIEGTPDKHFAMTAAFVHSPSKFQFSIKYFFDGTENSQPDDIKKLQEGFTSIQPSSGTLEETTFVDMHRPSVTDRSIFHIESPIKCGRWGTIMVSKFTSEFVNAVEKETQRAADDLKPGDWKIIVKLKPYRSDIFDTGNGSAWPYDRATSYAPILVFFQWNRLKDDVVVDEYYIQKMKTVIQTIQTLAERYKCTTPGAPVYSNMALDGYTTPKNVYGEDGLKELGKIRGIYDPRDVMSRAGGFKIPLRDV